MENQETKYKLDLLGCKDNTKAHQVAADDLPGTPGKPELNVEAHLGKINTITED